MDKDNIKRVHPPVRLEYSFEYDESSRQGIGSHLVTGSIRINYQEGGDRASIHCSSFSSCSLTANELERLAEELYAFSKRMRTTQFPSIEQSNQ